MELKPHYLLKVPQLEDLATDLPFPSWVNEALQHAPYVVVRRAERRKGLLPVGIRGSMRGQRWACWLPEVLVNKVITPFSLSDEKNWKARYRSSVPATVEALRAITSVMNETGYQWGPTGSTGFELATGVQVIKESSDLDLMIEVPQMPDVKTAKQLLDRLEEISSVRLDIQVNHASGGFSLKEYTTSNTVLLKTCSGPSLVDVNRLRK